MYLTKDGRKVQAVYDGNVFVYFVDEYKNSRYAKRIWVDSAGFAPEYYLERERLIAENDGIVPQNFNI